MRLIGCSSGMGVTAGGAGAQAVSVARGPRPVPRLLIGAALVALTTLLALSAASWLEGSAASHGRRTAGVFGHPLPAALIAAASSRIGSAEPAFWPVRSADALVTRGGGLVSTFTASGAQLRAPAGAVRLALTAVGRGERATPVVPASPTIGRSEVIYRRGSVSERYQAGPFGLEQSFVVSQAPRGGSGALTLRISTSRQLRAGATGSAVAFSTRSGAPALNYGELAARDASGRDLPAQLRLRGGVLLLAIDDRDARYPIRIDPFAQQGTKLTGGAEESGAGEFGASTALSADGSTALVGAPGDNSNAGAAWVFTRSGSSWEQQGPKLTGTGEEGKARFGFHVALSGGGNTALVGAPFDNAKAGAAWVFTRNSEGKWEQQGSKLTGKADESGAAEFGLGVALSGGEGNTALVGGGSDNGGAGAVWAFTRSSEGTWTQQGPKLTGGGETGAARLGFSVALSEDGNTALAGGGSDNNSAGAAWVFTRNSEEKWEQQGSKLTGTGEVGAGHVGFAVALSGDGKTAMLGGLADNGEVGAAWPFVLNGEGKWEQQGTKLTGSGETGKGLFGDSIALSSNGNLAVIGGDADAANIGAVWIFRRPASTWEQLGAKLTGGGESGKGRFGVGVSLSAGGTEALFGGESDSSETGAAWPFANTPAAPTVVTGSATAVAQTTATLNATVNPNGEAVTDCHFNYGTTPAYGSSVPCSTSPGSGASPVPVSASVSELKANTVYHFQIVAMNATGTSEGADQTFATRNPPEFGRCVKLATGVKGKFSTAACTLPATAEKFAYEWEPGAGAKPKWTTASSVAVTLETVGRKVISCKGESGSGEYTSAKSVGHVTMTFTGCEFSASKCASTGAGEGEIVTSTLEGQLGVEKKTSTSTKIALDLLPAGGTGPVAEFTCGTTPVTIRGSVLNPVTANKMAASVTVKYAQTAGKQKPEKFEGMPIDVLETATGEGAFEKTGLALTMTQTNGEKIEVNSVV